MPEILGFSAAVREQLRQVDLVQHREIDMRTPVAQVIGGQCSRCGFVIDLPSPLQVPADTFAAVTMYHRLDWKTGKQCGGVIEF